MENGVSKKESVEQYIEKADDFAKKSYMDRIWRMDKEQIFHELMRVHGESSKLLFAAQMEIEHLRNLLDPEQDGDAIH